MGLKWLTFNHSHYSNSTANPCHKVANTNSLQKEHTGMYDVSSKSNVFLILQKCCPYKFQDKNCLVKNFILTQLDYVTACPNTHIDL